MPSRHYNPDPLEAAERERPHGGATISQSSGRRGHWLEDAVDWWAVLEDVWTQGIMASDKRGLEQRASNTRLVWNGSGQDTCNGGAGGLRLSRRERKDTRDARHERKHTKERHKVKNEV